MDFYAKTGTMALGSRLRRLSERITEQAGAIYGLYGNDLQPKWFPVFYLLCEGKERSISDIAQEIGHSHASVSQIVGEMEARGFIREKKGKGDGRKHFVALTPKGKSLRDGLSAQYRDVRTAVEDAMKETHHDLWKAIGEWESLLDQKDLLGRVQAVRRRQAAPRVRVVDYTPAYQRAFRDLNERWISRYFKMEEPDYASLDHPQEYILDKGGHIFIALLDDKAVGAVALIPMDAHTQELAKMAVAPEAQGLNIGLLLGQAVIARARALGLERIYLESNTILKPAIHLYHKLGFERITGVPSPYERCNIQMELRLDSAGSSKK
jgi:DNA-binding MarR family transcriptional regulator/N-acetylglutamate synthase-like GNAT family acetyltransferase